jgi:hypothetical protein
MDTAKQSGENDRTESGKFAPGNRASPGRPRGSPNRSTSELKSAILQALDAAGGISYLTKLATSEPKVFATLLLRLLPSVPADASGNEVLLIDHDPDL